MSLDEYTPDLDQSEGLGTSSETQSEKVSEAFKEAVKKASAGIKRTQKDEKKAKKYDFLLASFLVKIIVDKKYDSILDNIFKTIDFGYSSNFVLGILSLIKIEISDKIREISKKEKLNFNFKEPQNIEFDDANVNPQVRNRINSWIEDIIDSTTIDFSSLKTIKNLELLEKDEEIIVSFTSKVFSFFLKDINIAISEQKALNISFFIISEVKKAVKILKIEKI